MTGAPEGWTIRAARSGDAESVADVVLEAGLDAWDYLDREVLESGLRSRLGLPDLDPDLVAEDGDGILGFVAWDPSTGEVTHLFTHPRAQGLGAGRALLGKACEALREAGRDEAWLHTEERNDAVGFYESLGWRERGDARVREWNGVMLREPRYALDL